jgi:Zn-dependent protease
LTLPPLESVIAPLVILLASLTVHEAAHAWTAFQLGDPTARDLGRLSLNPIRHIDPIGTLLLPIIALSSGAPIIGWAKPVPVDIRRVRGGRQGFLWVAAAGPISNLLLAGVASLLLRTMLSGDTSEGVSPMALMIYRALQLNVLLAVFNMLPIPPLDGGNVLAGLLPPAAARSFDRLRPYGFILLYVLLLTDVLDKLLLPPFRAIMGLLAP